MFKVLFRIIPEKGSLILAYGLVQDKALSSSFLHIRTEYRRGSRNMLLLELSLLGSHRIGPLGGDGK